jgi:NAD(P)-dependent dehydrogenase (short-subunit alcohol dehydrogenase family)
MKSINDLISFKGKTAVITGAAQGIGAQIAERLAEVGANIAILDIQLEASENKAIELSKKYSIEAKGYALDVSNLNDISSTIKKVAEDFGQIDVLVNNAGVYPMLPIQSIKEKDFDFLMNINLRGLFFVSQAVIEYMLAANQGVIINIASTAALKTAGNSAHYVASKHAVAGITKSQASELGKFGIRSITVAPTLVDTPGTRKLRQNPDIDNALKQFEEKLPLSRMANPDDIAKTVIFAASDMAAFITGIVIPVDGGETSF